MKNIEMPTLEELQEMAAVDIRTVDKSTLTDGYIEFSATR